tara:strand:- start:100 stop:540 length:441 start_codon:yes stop_codon:yes gene_type:complete
MPEKKKATTKKTSAKKKAAPKKAAPKKAAAPKGPTKAAMASALKEKGIPLPESGEAADMEHRLRYWKEGEMGYMIRIHRNAGKKYADHPLSLLNAPRKALYWLPASEMTDKILATRRVVVVGRVAKPSTNMTVIDVPSDYEQRFGA